MRCQVNFTVFKDGSYTYWVSKHSNHSFVGLLTDKVYDDGTKDETDYCIFHGTKKECLQWIDSRRKMRDDIFCCALYQVDRKIVNEDLIRYLDDNMSRDAAIDPDKMMSVCLFFWRNVSTLLMPSEDSQNEIKNHLSWCLMRAWKYKSGPRKLEAKKGRKFLRKLHKENNRHLNDIKFMCDAIKFKLDE